jgi:hypothetical protein
MKILRWALVTSLLIGTFAAIAMGKEGHQISHGIHHGTAWTVSVRSTPRGSHSACLDTSIQSRTSGSEATECGSVRNDLPLFGRLALGRGKQRLTVFTALMDPAAMRVSLNLAARGYQKMRIRHLGSYAAVSAGLEPFAYLTRSFVGPVCIRRLRAYDAEGALLTDIPFIRCHES